jgi:hypothetical protein
MAAWKYCGMANVCCKESKDHEYCLHSRSMRLLAKNANALGRQLPAKTGSSLPFSPISDKETLISAWHTVCFFYSGNPI